MKRIDLFEHDTSYPMRISQQPTSGTHGTQLSSTVSYLVQELQKEIGINADAKGGESLLTEEEIEDSLKRIQERVGIELSSLEKTQVLAQIEKEQKPFGILQPLVDDPTVSDIIISEYSKVTVQQGRKNYRTDISFSTPENYEAFVERLLSKASSTYSTKKPIADGMIGSFARIHAVHRSLCDTGPYVTIRLNRFSSVTIDDLAQTGLAPKPILEYLRVLVQTGHTLLLAGEVGTGKTTLARAVAAAIPSDEAIIVIEDTAEIRLDHPHVRYITTREANTEGAGRISPSECIRAGMRMAMNRIIFGEIRDAEAAESFIDVCASGHPGLSTIHSRSALEAVARLELFLGRAQKGVEKKVLTEQIATAVQVIVHVDICKVTGKRRIMEVKEIGPVADGVLRQREIFRYSPQGGIPSWKVVTKVSAHKEKLEDADVPVVLSSLPQTLDLSLDVLYRETAQRKSA